MRFRFMSILPRLPSAGNHMTDSDEYDYIVLVSKHSAYLFPLKNYIIEILCGFGMVFAIFFTLGSK